MSLLRRSAKPIRAAGRMSSGGAGALSVAPASGGWSKFALHLGLPLSLSLTIHALLLTLLALKLFDVTAHDPAARSAWEATVVQAPDDSDPFQPAGVNSPRAAVNQPLDAAIAELIHQSPSQTADLGDQSAPLPLDIVPDAGVRPTPKDGETLGLGSGSLALLGTGGGGDGAAGLASGLGGRAEGAAQAAIWNLNIRASRIAYVVDFSGSILTAVDDLKRELKRSIGKLSPGQWFNVILFYGAGGGQDEQLRTESFRPRLVPADAATRRAFFAWIDQHAPMGRTEPVPAIQRALALEPEAIFFFSDGFFDDRVIAEVRRLNQDSRTQIHCLVFDELLLEDRSGLPRETEGSRRLQRIAEMNGGRVKIVTGKDLAR